jgi:hypothetical protein
MIRRFFRWLIALLLAILRWLTFGLLGRPRRRPPVPGAPPAPGLPPGAQPAPAPAGHIPSQFSERTLPASLGLGLLGTPADGSGSGSAPGAERLSPVVWVDGGDEVVVYLDSLQVRILEQVLVVAVDVECDEIPRGPVVFRYAVGGHDDPAGLVAVTDEVPRGEPQLVARWGHILQTAIWASLIGLAQAHAEQRGHIPTGISVGRGTLSLKSAPAAASVRR